MAKTGLLGDNSTTYDNTLIATGKRNWGGEKTP